jgi:hypothetical protein
MSSGTVLKLVSICAYLTDVSVKWRGIDHTSSKMVKALKGDQINGYFEYQIAGRVRRFDQANIKEFLDRVPLALAKLMVRHVSSNATIVPIPNSHVIDVQSQNFRTLELAKAVARSSNGQFQAVPALVFTEPQVKSREGGPRDPYYFEGVYRLVTDVQGPIILLDDVCTSGAHMIGACWRLNSSRRNIILGATFGRTTDVQLSAPISVREEMLDISRI